MFKIEALTLQATAKRLVKGAAKSKLQDKALFLSTNPTDSTVTLFFTGDDVSVKAVVPVLKAESMEVATTLSEFRHKLSVLPSDEEITVKVEKNALVFVWGKNSKISCPILPETTPSIIIPEVTTQVTWSAGSLHGMARILPPFTASPQSEQAKSKPVVMGVYLEQDDTGETLVRATDAYKVVKIRAEKIQWFHDFECSIDSKTLETLAEILPMEAEVKIGLNPARTQLIFQAANVTVLARLLVGVFPNLDGALKTNGKGKWVFDRMELMEVCRRVGILKKTSPTVDFNLRDGKVFAEIPGTLSQQMAVSIEGEQFEFTVNAYYLELICALFQGKDEIELIMDSGNHPISVINSEDDAIRSLVLPVRR